MLTLLRPTQPTLTETNLKDLNTYIENVINLNKMVLSNIALLNDFQSKLKCVALEK